MEVRPEQLCHRGNETYGYNRKCRWSETAAKTVTNGLNSYSMPL